MKFCLQQSYIVALPSCASQGRFRLLTPGISVQMFGHVYMFGLLGLYNASDFCSICYLPCAFIFVAEFVIDLAKKNNSFDLFKVALIDNDAEFSVCE